MINGIINIYKEKGFTSRDAVNKLCGIIHQKKAGHTGTLDPMAEGVLPICLGNATKLCDLLTDHDKIYKAVIKLGVATDTEDVTGNVINTTDWSGERLAEIFNNGEFSDTVKSFIGDYDQIPPMYSAKKINGKKLYELAREGITVERKPNHVIIYDIVIDNVNQENNTAELTVHCGKGTYIRSLCCDIGEKLGCYACMAELTRVKVGTFNISQAYKLSEVERAVKENKLSELITPVPDLFPDYRKYSVSGHDELLLKNGGVIDFNTDNVFYGNKDRPTKNDLFLMYDSLKHFYAIYKYDGMKLRVEKYFG